MVKWMAVVPLIGGATLGCQESTGVAPMKIYSLNGIGFKGIEN